MSALDRAAHDAGIVASPTTGEVIDLATAPTETLAAYLDGVRDLERRLREQKAMATAEVLARMDREGRWTATLGDWKLTAPSPEPRRVYDAAALRADLEQLVADDLIAPAAAARAVEEVTTLKVSAAGVKALEKLGGPVADAVERHRTLETRDRRVSVTRQRGVE